MSFAEFRKQKSSEYFLLVPHRIIKRLNGILQNSFTKLEALCDLYSAQYNEQIRFFISYHNELVLEVQANARYNSMDEEKMPEGWSGLEELIHKIDFLNVLHLDVRRISDRKMKPEEVGQYESLHFFIEFSEDENGKKHQKLKLFPNCVGTEEIPNFFDKVQWKINGIYTGYVSNVYDPSKFWMRFAQVDLLQKHLNEFYNEHKMDYTLLYSELCVGLNCAVFIDNFFYRGKIVRTDIQEPNWFIVFLYDHGMVYRRHCDDFFKLHKKFAVFPAFAVRCALMNVSPLDNECWTQKAVDRFNELTKDEKRMAVKITHVKIKRKILELYLMDPRKKVDDKTPTLNNVLVQENLAKISWQPPVERKDNGVFKCLKEFTYLHPLHEMIENGTAPAYLALTEKLKKCVSWDVLFPELYEYVG